MADPFDEDTELRDLIRTLSPSAREHFREVLTAMYSHLFDDELDAKAAKLDARWREVGELASG